MDVRPFQLLPRHDFDRLSRSRVQSCAFNSPHLQHSSVRRLDDATTASFSDIPQTPTPDSWIVNVVELTANPQAVNHLLNST